MRKDPEFREPRLPAIAIWTLIGLLVGVALGVFTGLLLLLPIVGAALGLLYGLYSTRVKFVPEDD